MNAGSSVAGRRGPTAAVIAAVALLAAAASLAVLGVAAVPDAAAQQDAACREGLESIMKNADASMACVSPGTKAVLIERGWGSEVPVPDMDATAGDGDMAAAVGDALDGYVPPADDVPLGEVGEGDTPVGSDGVGAVMGTGMGGGDMEGDMASLVPKVDLSAEEIERLTGSGAPIRVAYDPLRIPIEFYDDEEGYLGGISGEYLRYLELSLDADFEPLDLGEMSLLGGPYAAVQSGAADVVLALDAGSGGTGGVLFTAPHTDLPIVLVSAVEGTTIDAATLSGMNVGAVSGYGAARWLDTQVPGTYEEYGTAIEAVGALGEGQIEVLVALWPVASYTSMMMQSDQPVAVYNAGETGEMERLSVGYGPGDAALGSALEKAIAAAPPEFKAMVTEAVSNPVGALFDMMAEKSGEEGVDLAGVAEEIDELNRSSGMVEEKLLASPEARAFAEQYPEYETRFDDFGFAQAQLEMAAAGGDASLLIEYDKDAESFTFRYECTDADANPQSHHSDSGIDMVALIKGPCTEPGFG